MPNWNEGWQFPCPCQVKRSHLGNLWDTKTHSESHCSLDVVTGFEGGTGCDLVRMDEVGTEAD
jgi:hypothetical protein